MINDFNLSESDGDVLIPVRVIPRASRTQIDGVYDGSLKIRLKAPPVDGAANQALCEFLAKTLGCRKRDVDIARGERSRDKLVRVSGTSIPAVREQLAGALT